MQDFAATLTAPAMVGQARPPAAALLADRARPDILRFAAITVQLGLIVAVCSVYTLDEGLRRTAIIGACAFVVHYWLPFRWKEPWWIAASLTGGALIVGPTIAGPVVVAGLVFYGLMASPLAYRMRVALALGLLLALAWGRLAMPAGIPRNVWPVIGALFMFRLFVYLYDLRSISGRPGLREFLAYFFPLPNFAFLLFPVIDYSTQRRTYYQRDIHAIAQQGVAWMARGLVHLLAYRLIDFLRPPFSPEGITSPGTLALGLTMVYLLYLRVSGHFHFVVGLMHLFGYDLPSTHRNYLLARSITDFWRRINVYWKDFMVKLVYFPVYFGLRRSGETRAHVLASVAVFIATWLLHVYQGFWLRGEVVFSTTDVLFWTILGALATATLVVERRRRGASAAAEFRAGDIPRVGLTFTVIVMLWGLWNSASLAEWWDIMTWWKVG